MSVETSRAFTNALLADACYVEGLMEGQTDSALAESLAGRLTQPLADYQAGRSEVVTRINDESSGLSLTVWRQKDSHGILAPVSRQCSVEQRFQW